MKTCPNCGRPTARTKDWACQWCGYPLLSESYQAIPQTYSELKGMKKPEEKPPVPAPVLKAEVKPEPAPVLKAEVKREPEPEPEVKAAPEPAPVLEVKVKREPEPEPEPEVKAAPKPEPVLEAEVKPEPAPVLEAEVKREPEPEPEVEVAPEPAPVLEAEVKREPEPEPEVKAAPEPAPVLEAEVKREPEPEPQPVLEAEPAVDSLELNIDQLYSRLQADQAAAEARYMNQVLKITGLVYRTIINENLTVAYVILASATKHEERQVTCAFDRKHDQAINRLNEGDTATVQGTYDGYTATVLLRDCTLV